MKTIWYINALLLLALLLAMGYAGLTTEPAPPAPPPTVHQGAE